MATGALSAVLPNTPLVALAAPRVVTWCRRAGVSASPYLIPLSYAAVSGGVVTVIAALGAPPPVRRHRSGVVIVAIVAMVVATVTNVLDRWRRRCSPRWRWWCSE